MRVGTGAAPAGRPPCRPLPAGFQVGRRSGSRCALVGRAERSLDFETLVECETLTVSSNGGSIEIALDGELKRMDSPLEFRIRAGGLTVMTPGDAEKQ
jgi:hypothetical protein